MRKGYEKQILDHNVEMFSFMIKADLDMFSSAKTLTQADRNATLQINSVSGAKKIMEDLKWHFRKDESQRLQYSCLSTNYWCLAETVADKADDPGLVDALAVFIKQERAKVKGVESTLNKRRKDDDLSWAGKYPIQIHGSIATWTAKGDDGGEMQYERQTVRYAFEWQKSEDGWRRDHLWVKKYPIGSKNP